jgi:hypothetical protein
MLAWMEKRRSAHAPDHAGGEASAQCIEVPGAWIWRASRRELVDRLLAALRDGNGEPALHVLLKEERAGLLGDTRRAILAAITGEEAA